MAFAGEYEGLGISKKWSRILKGGVIAATGIAAGYYGAPKIKAFLESKGFPPGVAADLASKVAAGKQKLPADLEAEMKATVPPPPAPAMPAWAWPVGIGVLVIGAMMFMGGGKRFRRNPRRRYVPTQAERRAVTAAKRRIAKSPYAYPYARRRRARHVFI